MKYHCAHCSKVFEAEEKDIIECPGCFWTSSVKRVDEAGDRAAEILNAPQAPKASFKIPWSLLLVFVILGGCVYAVFFNWDRLKSLIPSNLANESIHIPESEEIAASETSSDPTSSLLTSPWDTLSEKDRNILSRRSVFTHERQVSAEENEILTYRAPYETGIVEKLPSGMWSLERFKQLVENQENVYRVPLPRSYKKKLEKHFVATHLPGNQAFENSEILAARDGWVSSLAIPMYSNDLKKHRGVALTMLRPFITDTLSKISAVNNILMERKIRDREIWLSESYGQLLVLLADRSWNKALSLSLKIKTEMDRLMEPEGIVNAPPRYPMVYAQIDEGIRQTLAALQEIPTPAVSDYAPILVDINRKEAVIRSFMPVELEKQTMFFNRGMDGIQRKLAVEAIREFSKIEYPVALVSDAKEKMGVLKRIQQSQP